MIIDPILSEMVKREASDSYLTVGFPASIRIGDRIMNVTDHPLTEDEIHSMLWEIVDADKREQFESSLELNSSMNWQDRARFRINVFQQQGVTGAVIRRIRTDIPTIEELKLPKVYSDVALLRRGLVLVTGPTGSGKTTSLASIIGHRNRFGSGHVITIEDPIEFVHTHKGCIFTQREVGIDTYSFSAALKNALRQRPDVVVIGEIRDAETMDHAINFADTGHLCLATLHANNTVQALERIINLFPEQKHKQKLQALSQVLNTIICQRLVQDVHGGKSLAVEIMLNRGYIGNLILEGKTKEIPDMIAKGINEGMMTFDQSLLDMYRKKVITEDVAIAESDNPANMRLTLKMGSKAVG